jgi:hypothetical protein
LRKISSGGSVMLLSRLSPLLPPPLAPHSAILKVPGHPHQPWRYMRIYLTAKRPARIYYANEPRPRPASLRLRAGSRLCRTRAGDTRTVEEWAVNPPEVAHQHRTSGMFLFLRGAGQMLDLVF